MDRIIIAFAHSTVRDTIVTLTERSGFSVRLACRSGAEVLREVQRMGAGVVVCGYRLSDMTADALAVNLEGRARLLVVSNAANLERLDLPEDMKLAPPLSVPLFREKLSALVELDEKIVQASISQRSDAEKELIAAAKAVLMARGMTEPEAHAYLQRRSMSRRCKMTHTAQEVLEGTI